MKTKAMMASSMIGVLALVAGGFLWQRSRLRPSESATLGFLNAQTAGNVVYQKMTRTLQAQSDGNFEINFDAQGTTPEPLYLREDTANVLKLMQLETPRLSEAASLLEGPMGKRIREMVGSTEVPPDPLSAIVLHETTARGVPFSWSGALLAHRAGNWQFSQVPSSPAPPNPPGKPRAAYGEKTYVIGVTADESALQALVARQIEYVNRIEGARASLAQEFKKQREARFAQFVGTLKPGMFFLGQPAGSPDAEAVKLILELVELNPNARQLSAKIRNDGGWADARLFQGSWVIDDTAENFVLTLSSRSDQAIRGGGPILAESGTATIPLKLQDDNRLTGHAGRFDYVFAAAPEPEMAKLKTDLSATWQTAIEATHPDLIYQGQATSKHTGTAEAVLLRFVTQDKEGANITAVLESPEHGAWKRSALGSLNGSRYRAQNGKLIQLDLAGSERIHQASTESVFGTTADLQIMLQPEGKTLTGEDALYTFRLEQAGPDFLAALAQKRAAAAQRFSAVIKAGVVYDGSLRDKDNHEAHARLRIVSVNASDNTLVASIDSRDRGGVTQPFSGTYDAAGGTLNLTSTGKGRNNPGMSPRVPFFVSNSACTVNLALGDSAITGALDTREPWAVEFSLNEVATAAMPGAEPLPENSGAYALIEGKWQALPRNGGKATQGLVGKMGDATKHLFSKLSKSKSSDSSGTGEKSGELIFSGTVPLPIASGAQLALSFRGTLPNAPVGTPSDYPVIEVAHTTIQSDGKRKADLFSVGANVTGFGSSRLPTTLETLADDVIQVRFTDPLPAGTYAVSVNGEMYEFSVK